MKQLLEKWTPYGIRFTVQRFHVIGSSTEPPSKNQSWKFHKALSVEQSQAVNTQRYLKTLRTTNGQKNIQKIQKKKKNSLKRFSQNRISNMYKVLLSCSLRQSDNKYRSANRFLLFFSGETRTNKGWKGVKKKRNGKYTVEAICFINHGGGVTNEEADAGARGNERGASRAEFRRE